MNSSEGFCGVVRRIVLVTSLGVLFAAPAPAAPRDIAPMPDEVVHEVVRKHRERRVNPVPDILRRHLKEASELVDQVEQVDRKKAGARERETAHETKRMLLRAKVGEINALRQDVERQFAETRARLVSVGASEKVRSWDALLMQVRSRFDRVTRALEEVRSAKDSRQRSRTLGKAKSELKALYRQAEDSETLPSPFPHPTFREETPTDQKPDPHNAAPPQYWASQSSPRDYAAAGWGRPLRVQLSPDPQAATCGYTAQDLAATLDVQLTAEVRALAKQLGYSPTKLYQYVVNTIRFEPYYGSLKGAMGTLVSGAGNATDQASLLIALLRASNIPARYVKGTALFADDRVLRWVGAKTYQAAALILRKGQIPTSYSASHIEMTHVWVEACVPYGNYRGTAVDQTGHRWIPLDPSFKNIVYQDGIPTNVDFDYNGYLAARTDQLPHEKYQEQVEAYIKTVGPRFQNNTIEDVGYVGRQVPLELDVLPASLPYQVATFTAWTSGGSAEVAELPDAHRYKLEISTKKSDNSPLAPTLALSMPDVVLKRITFSFRPTSEDQNAWNGWDKDFSGTVPSVNVVPVIKVEGVERLVGSGVVSLGAFTKLTLALSLPDVEPSWVNSVEYPNIRAGAYHALQTYAFQTSDRLLRERAAKLLDAVRDTPSDEDATRGEFLHVVGLKYMRYVSDSMKLIASLDGGSGLSGNHLGLTSSNMKVEYLFDLPYAVSPGELLIDVPKGVLRSVDLVTGIVNWKTLRLSGYALSAYEHYVWQENARLDAVSTVRGLQFARETGVEILTLTNVNFQTEKGKLTSNSNAALNYSPGEVNALEGLVLGGATVTLPRRLIQYQNWLGSVWASENPSSEQLGFMINARYNGGYTVDIPLSVTTSYNVPSSTVDYLTNSTTMNTGYNATITFSGDPVNMATGNMYHTERDLAIKARGTPFVFERSYNSARPEDGPLGFGWTHSFNHSLKFEDDNYNGSSDSDSGDSDGLTSAVVWVDGTGGKKSFPVTGNASGVPIGSAFSKPPGVFVQVSRGSDGMYTIREKNGFTYTFSAVNGTVGQIAQLTSLTDRNGNVFQLSYSSGRLESVRDGLLRTLTFIYTGNHIFQVKDWTNRTHQYEYDGSGNLIRYKNPLALAGSQPPVVYDYYSDAQLNHAMKSYTLPKGNGMTFEYYMNGKVFKHYNSLGETTTFTYNEFRRETVLVNERGFTRRYFFDKNGNPTKIVEENGGERTYTYDPANPMDRLSERNPLGYVTQYAYDGNGNVTRITLPSGSTVEYSGFNGFNQPGKVKDTNPDNS